MNFTQVREHRQMMSDIKALREQIDQLRAEVQRLDERKANRRGPAKRPRS